MSEPQRLIPATHRLAAALLVAATAFVLLVAWHQRGMAVDDAFITFRYADNLVAGHGLRWNPGSPPCEGYSNLSYVVALAGLHTLGLDFPSAALLLASLGVVVISACLWRGMRGAGAFTPLAAVPAAFVLASTDLTVHASRGLETVAFAALATAQLLAIARLCGGGPTRWRHGVVAAALATLAFLTRPDGVLLSALGWLGAAWLVRGEPARRRVLALAVGLWLAAGGLYAAWKLSWFGYLLPNPFYMKAAVEGLPGLPETRAFVDAYAPLLLTAALAAIAAPWWLRPRAHTAPAPTAAAREAAPFLALVMALPWLAYGAKIVHEIGFAHRFAWPLVPVLAVGAARGLAVAGARAATGRWRRAWPLAWLALAAAAMAGAPAIRDGWRVLQAPPPEEPVTAAFVRLGAAIRDTGIAPQLTLFCANAGATPFVAGAHHVDPVGLVDDGYCLRTPEAERGRYQASLRFDIVAWNLFPASPGATSFADDPRALASTYLRRFWTDEVPELDAHARYANSFASHAERQAGLFTPMWVLREHATLVGEMRLSPGGGRLFVYVWKQSPHHDRLVAHLAARVDVPAAAIDYDHGPFEPPAAAGAAAPGAGR